MLLSSLSIQPGKKWEAIRMVTVPLCIHLGKFQEGAPAFMMSRLGKGGEDEFASDAMEKALLEVRKRLLEKGKEMKADGILDVRISMSPFGEDEVMLIAVGTAIRYVQ
jgi:uncharacterized protein YbjQ (UPF0145 family)